MEEYAELVTKISGELWKEFKPRITADTSKDEFWDKAIESISCIADSCKGTIAEGYAIDMAVFYLLELQRIHRKDFEGGRYSDYRNVIHELTKAMKVPNFDFKTFFEARQ